MVLTLEKVPDSNAHDDHEDQDYELSIHLLLPSAIVAQSSVSATHSHGPLHCYPGSDESEQKFFAIHPTETMWRCFQPRSIEMKRID
jgi:hypothetical protein